MTARRTPHQTRLHTEIGHLVALATEHDCTALQAAAMLPFTPTNKAIEQAHHRLLDDAGLPPRRQPLDAFAGLPR